MEDPSDPGKEPKVEFRFETSAIPGGHRQLRKGQIVSISSTKENIQFAARIGKISEKTIVVELIQPDPAHLFGPAESVRVKYWDEELFFYFNSEVVSQFGPSAETFTLTTPTEATTLPRRKVYRVHGSIPISFTIVEAAAEQLLGQGVQDAHADDITIGALSFKTPMPLKKGDKLDMTITLPPKQPVNVLASVIRSTEVPGDQAPLYSVALKFHHFDVLGQNTLLLFLSQSEPENEFTERPWG